jgi:archaemetzincin
LSINQPDIAASYIEILPIGDIDEEVIRLLEMAINLKIGLNTYVSKKITVPPSAYNRNRNQYNSRMILNEISKKQKGNCLNLDLDNNTDEDLESECAIEKKYLAVIDADLYADGLNYVFGQAILGGCCAVISLTRLRRSIETAANGRDLFFSRIEKEAVHELGHVFGLRHCPDPACVMYLSGNLADTDRKSADFCPRCNYR